MGNTWVIDLRHFLDPNGSMEHMPGPARRLAEHFAAIVFSLTADIDGDLHLPPVKCRRRPQRKPCPGVIDTTFDEDDRIVWACSSCDDNGFIAGWQGTLWDLLHLPPLQ